MSQMQRFFVDIESLEGNSGGPVEPINGNIDILGAAPIDVVGNPLTGTLTISAAASVATQYDANTGSAIPVGHILNVLGAHNINTIGAGNNISVRGNNTVTLGDLSPVVGNSLTLTSGNETITSGDLTLSSGDIHVAGNIAVSSLTNHGILIGHGASNVTSSTLTDGQLLIGSTGVDPVAAGLTAGAGISITPGAGSITITNMGITALNYTNVAVTPYVVLVTDQFLSVDTSTLSITVKLPDAATSGQVFIIKDRIGDAATRNITVTTVTGAVLIDGATTFVMNTAYQAIQIIGSGVSYEVY